MRRSKVLVLATGFLCIAALTLRYRFNIVASDKQDLHEGLTQFYHRRSCEESNGKSKANEAIDRLLSSGVHSSNTIPLIVHQTYASKQIPGDYVPYLITLLRNINDEPSESGRNERVRYARKGKWSRVLRASVKDSAIRYAFWTDAALKRFVHREFPEFEDLFNSYSHALERADMARYLILLRFGGVYIDMDVEFKRPLRDLLAANRHGCVLAQDLPLMVRYLWKRSRSVTNAFMACEANSTLMRRTVELVDQSAWTTSYHPDGIVYRTGPFVLDAAVRDLLNESLQQSNVSRAFSPSSRANKSRREKQSDLLIAPASWFSGNIDAKHFSDVRKACISALRRSLSSANWLAERFWSLLSVSFHQYVRKSDSLKDACLDFLHECGYLLQCESSLQQVARATESQHAALSGAKLDERGVSVLEQLGESSLRAPPFAFADHRYLNVGYLNGSLPTGARLWISNRSSSNTPSITTFLTPEDQFWSCFGSVALLGSGNSSQIALL